MSKEEIIKLKLEIYQEIYDAIAFNNNAFVGEKINRLKAQLELLEELKEEQNEL